MKVVHSPGIFKFIGSEISSHQFCTPELQPIFMRFNYCIRTSIDYIPFLQSKNVNARFKVIFLAQTSEWFKTITFKSLINVKGVRKSLIEISNQFTVHINERWKRFHRAIILKRNRQAYRIIFQNWFQRKFVIALFHYCAGTLKHKF